MDKVSQLEGLDCYRKRPLFLAKQPLELRAIDFRFHLNAAGFVAECEGPLPANNGASIRLANSSDPGKSFLQFAQAIFTKPLTMANDDF